MNPMPFADSLSRLLKIIVIEPALHAKWLNTLSYLENCGARKIASCEHPTLIKEEMLKHAAEEFRHAHYLKRQLEKISSPTLNDYSFHCILGGTASLHYLSVLDLQTSRYLLSQGFSKRALKEACYLLVTYAIELRAEQLYPIYENILRELGSKVVVKSIILEEKEHLNDMRRGLLQLPSGLIHSKRVCAFEENLCNQWLKAITKEVG